ncbi:MAG: excinuclease ABC subunit UvrA [Verrucomicrobia bacterium]|nr:MAG: excinuclease ABC subunit UvrA [Verrucomicrobiota bacterium]
MPVDQKKSPSHQRLTKENTAAGGGTGGHFIRIKGARQHNLKGLDVAIPRNQFVVVTGVSGSGKSSLAFDTLYAEGQRKYVESLSAYARQFLDKMQKPDVDFIEGLSPAIAIEQRTALASPRSTIATTTEIYDYLRLLYAAVGLPHDPETGEPVICQTPQQIIEAILTWKEGTRLILLAPLVRQEIGELGDVIEKARRGGFVRLRIDGKIVEVEKPIRLVRTDRHDIEAVIDRIVIKKDVRQRLADSVEVALRQGGNQLTVLSQANSSTDWEQHQFSTHYSNPRTGFTIPRLTSKHFSFNSHTGACPACHGIGSETFFDPNLMVDSAKTLDEGAVRIWRTSNSKMKRHYATLLDKLVSHFGIRRNQPFHTVSAPFWQALFYGMEEKKPSDSKESEPFFFEGIVPQAERLFAASESELTRKRLRMFMSRRVCQVCKGARLRPEILAVTIESTSRQRLNISQFCQMTIEECRKWIETIRLSESQRHIVADILREISHRIDFLLQVGLGYLTLNRESSTLSGGEAQRIRLATQIGSGLSGVLYVLDEPSIGLHQRDNMRLIHTLRSLRDLGNSVIVVEHDEDTIRAADYILDLGPGAGPYGGQMIAQGTLKDILETEESLTAQYLNGRLKIPVPQRRALPSQSDPTSPATQSWITVTGARENNLKNITAAFPLGCLTCVTGVSGSGKSTLVIDVLYSALARHLAGAKATPGRYDSILGLENLEKVFVIDQTPLGRTPRSNPATYSGIFGIIRDLFAGLPAARVRGYDASRFSFNLKGGRCEHCQGAGVIQIEMHFLADVFAECEVCHGKRYNRETLEITYKGKNIAEVLDLSVGEAGLFFRSIPAISSKLETLQEVGLDYIRLGQSAATLSGGEAQRIKLAFELAKKGSGGRNLYILDEPTTGLHFADIHKLLEVLIKLRDTGNTLIVIEHNLEVIKCADWVIDLGPEAGEMGGSIVIEGSPEEVARHPQSHTGHYLQKIFSGH